MSSIKFSAKWLGLNKLRKGFKAISTNIGKTIGQGYIEEYFLKRTKDRFKPKGTAPTAQTSPEGIPWKEVSDVTIKRRKSNRNKAQALFDTGTLEGAIVILRSNWSDPIARQSSKGAIAQIGVSKGSPAHRYFLLHQYGGKNKEGFMIHPRPFLGVGPEDERYVNENIYSLILKGIRNAF